MTTEDIKLAILGIIIGELLVIASRLSDIIEILSK